MRTLSLSSLTVLPCSPLEQIDAAHAAGFDAVGLRLNPALPTDIDVMADASLRRAIERRISSTGVRVLDVDVIRVGPETVVSATGPLLEYAGRLGAQNIVFTSLPRDRCRSCDEQSLASKVAELCDLAGRYGIRPIVEFVPFRGIGSLTDALRLGERVNHPNFGICVDALHHHRSGGLPVELADMNPLLLASIQLCDAPQRAPADLPAESRYNRLYPGEGELPLVELLAAAPPDVPVSVEVPNAEERSRSPLERARKAAGCARHILSVAEARRRGKANAVGDQGGELAGVTSSAEGRRRLP